MDQIFTVACLYSLITGFVALVTLVGEDFFFSWPLYFFKLRFLNTPLVSSNVAFLIMKISRFHETNLVTHEFQNK